ncbi:MAG: hypothetical protein IJ560_04465 [Alphaproteobacteria bacterium]|nr:hypothetical protein [Alphaproteobacteria bacterium]
MKNTILLFVFCLVITPAVSAPARRAMSDQMASAPRATASVGMLNSGVLNNPKPTVHVEPPVAPAPTATDGPVADNRDKERNACLGNNIGVGNTFVWASRYSNTSDYSSMVEDTENPENNICFVRVELKSSDSRIDLSDITGRYFEMGRNIECGSWVDEEKLAKRILDAKKTARTWATVGGAVGGAGVGVGAMELFGNKLIGGAVQGQKALSGDDLFASQLMVLKKENKTEYDKIISELKSVKQECDKTHVDECDSIDYEKLLATESAK